MAFRQFYIRNGFSLPIFFVASVRISLDVDGFAVFAGERQSPDELLDSVLVLVSTVETEEGSPIPFHVRVSVKVVRSRLLFF